MTATLDTATENLRIARAEALLAGDGHAAERLGKLADLTAQEAEYAHNRDRLGLPMVPAPAATEWLPGALDPDRLAALGDAHTHQLAKIEAAA